MTDRSTSGPTTTSAAGLEPFLTRYGPEGLDHTETLIVPLWEAIYGTRDDPFYSTERFLGRLRGYAAAPGFSMVIATETPPPEAAEAPPSVPAPVGLSCGYTLPVRARWWHGLVSETADGFTDETGHRTFAVNEILVHPDRQGHGIATLLHDRLLSDRTEERATLLVNPHNTRARDIYIAWGWRPAAVLKPFPDSPTYDAMIIDLPLPKPRTK